MYVCVSANLNATTAITWTFKEEQKEAAAISGKLCEPLTTDRQTGRQTDRLADRSSCDDSSNPEGDRLSRLCYTSRAATGGCYQ